MVEKHDAKMVRHCLVCPLWES